LTDFDYDLFVIGAGSGGVRASRIAASLGARVAVAEERYFGGTCVNVGCVPKKLFSYAAHFRDDFEDSRGFGWQLSASNFDWSALVKNKDKEINRLNNIYKSILDNNGVTVFSSRAILAGPNQVEVEGKVVSARYILLAVGGWPWTPDYPGHEHVLNSNDLFAMESLPRSMLIQGAGYIGVEFASIFARFGVETSMVFRREQVLRGFDSDVREFVTGELAHDINLLSSDDIKAIDKQGKGLQVTLESGTEMRVEAVLAATGRQPLTDNLGLENTRVETSKYGGIVVDQAFQSAEPSIYAVGDVIERMELTPVALAEAELVARALFSDAGAVMDYSYVPTAVFCHPNVGTVGLTEEAASAQGLEFDVYLNTTKPLKHTLSGRDERALLKLLVEKQSQRILGMHVVCQDAGELVQGFAVAIKAGATKTDFDSTIGIHPTLAEELVTMRDKRD